MAPATSRDAAPRGARGDDDLLTCEAFRRTFPTRTRKTRRLCRRTSSRPRGPSTFRRRSLTGTTSREDPLPIEVGWTGTTPPSDHDGPGQPAQATRCPSPAPYGGVRVDPGPGAGCSGSRNPEREGPSLRCVGVQAAAILPRLGTLAPPRGGGLLRERASLLRRHGLEADLGSAPGGCLPALGAEGSKVLAYGRRRLPCHGASLPRR